MFTTKDILGGSGGLSVGDITRTTRKVTEDGKALLPLPTFEPRSMTAFELSTYPELAAISKGPVLDYEYSQSYTFTATDTVFAGCQDPTILYASQTNMLYKVNPVTGSAVLVYNNAAAGSFNQIKCSDDGLIVIALYMNNGNNRWEVLYSFNGGTTWTNVVIASQSSIMTADNSSPIFVSPDGNKMGYLQYSTSGGVLSRLDLVVSTNPRGLVVPAFVRDLYPILNVTVPAGNSISYTCPVMSDDLRIIILTQWLGTSVVSTACTKDGGVNMTLATIPFPAPTTSGYVGGASPIMIIDSVLEDQLVCLVKTSDMRYHYAFSSDLGQTWTAKRWLTHTQDNSADPRVIRRFLRESTKVDPLTHNGLFVFSYRDPAYTGSDLGGYNGYHFVIGKFTEDGLKCVYNYIPSLGDSYDTIRGVVSLFPKALGGGEYSYTMAETYSPANNTYRAVRYVGEFKENASRLPSSDWNDKNFAQNDFKIVADVPSEGAPQ